jgi:hypothetical protein
MVSYDHSSHQAPFIIWLHNVTRRFLPLHSYPDSTKSVPCEHALARHVWGGIRQRVALGTPESLSQELSPLALAIRANIGRIWWTTIIFGCAAFCAVPRGTPCYMPANASQAWRACRHPCCTSCQLLLTRASRRCACAVSCGARRREEARRRVLEAGGTGAPDPQTAPRGAPGP